MTDHQPPPAVELAAAIRELRTMGGLDRFERAAVDTVLSELRHSVEREAGAWAFVESMAKRDENKSVPGIYADPHAEGFSDGYNEACEEVATEARAALDRRAEDA